MWCVSGLPVLKGYVAARRGEREEMQDAHVLLPDMSACLAAPPAHVYEAEAAPPETPGVLLTCPVLPTVGGFPTSPCSTVTEELERLSSQLRICTKSWPGSSPSVS